MTETPTAHPTDPFDADALNGAEGLDPVDPAYAQVLRIATALNLIPLAIGASVFDALLIRHLEGPYGLITAAAWLIAIIVIVTFPSRRVSRCTCARQRCSRASGHSARAAVSMPRMPSPANTSGAGTPCNRAR